MKRCPNCNRTYTDEALNFCLEDGTPLLGATENNETMRYGAPRSTNPPPTEIYRPAQAPTPPPPVVNRAPHFQPQWSPGPVVQPRKSHAVWWVLGGLAVLVILGIGIGVILLAIASINSASNSNRVIVANSNTNRNANSNRLSNTNSARANTNSTPSLPSSFSDDFSEQKWTVASSDFGNLWYVNDEYHMRSKDQTYVVMYGPSADYGTENATVQVTARNVDGISPASGYGLTVHGEKSKDDKLEDYTFLIFTGPEPKYKVLLHKGGTETSLVPWTPSTVIRKGTATNQLEVRIKGPQLSFYINDQFITDVTDTANYKRGRAGLYTSDVHEVAFDDMEITR
ncbi:MAG: hypothetical protein JWM21_4193 [Acidobacteria bacterium]|nr:hypothetical protein [Acidobacteriota bacterium]